MTNQKMELGLFYPFTAWNY